MMNKVTLEGRIGRDANVIVLNGGKTLVTTTCCTSNDYLNKSTNEWVKRPGTWHNLVAFGNIGLENVKKGDKIKVEGKINYREYDGKDGTKKKITEIQVFNIEIQASQPKPKAEENYDDEDVPF